jgi:hypothetical protein
MKHLFIILSAIAALLFVSSTASAQEHKNEISLSYGVGTETDIASFYADILTAIFNVRADETTFGSANLNYTYCLNKTIGIGATFSYARYTCKLLDSDGNDDGSRQKTNYFTVMPTIKANWLHKKIVTLYSRAGAGLIIGHTKNIDKSSNPQETTSTDYFFGFQLSPIGVEVGRACCGFAEAGFGQEGILQLGVRYKF